MADIRPVRGTHDLYGEAMRRHRRVVGTARRTAALYGYEEIATPIFEFAEVFQRSLGETSDVVSKEMYAFEDRGGERLVLRPENTAGVVRAVLSNGLLQGLPLKLFYAGPMFRYERPQKGRQRQFHQIGVELIGAAEPLADVEVVALGSHVLEALGLEGRYVLEINSLGDPESRAAYRDVLVGYLEGHKGRLSEDSLRRLERNPLRILDSKDEGDRAVVAEAPRLGEHLNAASRDFFAAVLDGLGELGIACTQNPNLVRGLDYYTHTAFEFTTPELGAQSALIAGGRYDGLVGELGGPATPGVGWAAGIERLAMLSGEPPPPVRPVALVPIGPEAGRAAAGIADRLRRAGVAVELAFRGKPAQRMKRADRANACLALFLGDDELAQGAVKLRDLDTKDEETLPLDGLESALASRLGQDQDGA
ncbi:MAG: histidine--tRNA ligase [Geminicoccaceae bacterium]|nr:histidine--tRNA ligase [Geminicoccaceae bacterium]